jgi:hypothetical protein
VKFNHRGAQKKSRQGNLTHQSTPPAKLTKSAISNQCGRLLANVAIAYNSMLLSRLLERYQATGNQKAPQSLKAISPVAWQHIHFLGHYTFRDNRHPIDLDALLANVTLG